MVEGLLGWLGDHGLGKKWEKRNRAARGFSEEDRPRQFHPLGYGVMKGNYVQQLAKAFKGQVIYTKESFRLDGGVEH